MAVSLRSRPPRGTPPVARLLRMASIVTQTQRLRPALATLARETTAVCRADRCSIFLWRDDALVSLVSVYAAGLPRDLRRSFKSLRLGRLDDVPAFARARRDRRPVVVADVSRDVAAAPEWCTALAGGPFVALPLHQGHRFLGLLVLDNSVTARPVSTLRMDVAAVIAAQAALAIDHARLAGEMRTLIQEAETLLNVGSTATGSLELPEIVRRITREAARSLGADSAGIYVVNDGEHALQPLAAYHLPKQFLDGLRREPLVWSEFEPLVEKSRWSDDVANDPAFAHPVLKKFPMQSALLVPLEFRQRRLGFLVCAWWTAKRAVKPEEVRLMEAIAGQAALAIEAARLAAIAEQTAVGRERTRMDSLLHDTLSSTLFALALKLDGCLHRAESEEFRTMLEGVKQHAKTMMSQIRGLVAPQTA